MDLKINDEERQNDSCSSNKDNDIEAHLLKSKFKYGNEFELSNKVPITELNKFWTPEMAGILSIMSYNSLKNWWINNEDANYYNLTDQYLTSISSLLTVCSSLTVTAILGMFDENQLVFYVFSGITIVLNLLVTLINTWKYIHNYTKKIHEHSDKANKYNELHRKITSQFAMPLSQRYSAIVLLDFTIARLAELDREKPFTREVTSKKWDSVEFNFVDEIFKAPSELSDKCGPNFFVKVKKQHDSGFFERPRQLMK